MKHLDEALGGARLESNNNRDQCAWSVHGKWV